MLARKYIEVFERLTGRDVHVGGRLVEERIERNLAREGLRVARARRARGAAPEGDPPPGLDGSGRLFAPLLAAGPRRSTPSRLLPAGPAARLRRARRARAAAPAARALRPHRRVFSGPLRCGSRRSGRAGSPALVLAATFLHRPLDPLLHPVRGLVGARLFGVPMPAAVVRHFMAGPDAPDALVAEVQRAVGAGRGRGDRAPRRARRWRWTRARRSRGSTVPILSSRRRATGSSGATRTRTWSRSARTRRSRCSTRRT